MEKGQICEGGGGWGAGLLGTERGSPGDAAGPEREPFRGATVSGGGGLPSLMCSELRLLLQWPQEILRPVYCELSARGHLRVLPFGVWGKRD